MGKRKIKNIEWDFDTHGYYWRAESQHGVIGNYYEVTDGDRPPVDVQEQSIHENFDITDTLEKSSIFLQNSMHALWSFVLVSKSESGAKIRAYLEDYVIGDLVMELSTPVGHPDKVGFFVCSKDDNITRVRALDGRVVEWGNADFIRCANADFYEMVSSIFLVSEV